MSNSEAQLDTIDHTYTSDEHRELELRDYLNAVPHHVWTTDSTGTRVTWFNQHWFEYSGLSPEQALEDGGVSILHPDDAPALARVATDALASQSPFSANVRLRSKNGQYCWFQVRSEPVKHAGQIVRWIGTNTDVHEQHMTSEARERARTRIEGLQRTTAALAKAIGVKDVIDAVLKSGLETVGAYAGGVFLIDERREHLILQGQVGYPQDAVRRASQVKLNSDVQIAVTIRDNQPHFLTREDYTTQFKASLDHLAAPSVAVATLPLAVADTVIGGLAISFDQATEFSSGERGFLISLADLTAQALERARLFDQAARIQQRFESALSSSRTGVWEYDPANRDIVYDGAYAELYGLPAGWGRVNALDILELTPLEDRTRGYEATRKAFETGDWLESEFRIQLPGQDERWVFSRGRTVATPDGVRLAGTVTDVTDRWRARAALEESETNFRVLADSMPQLTFMAHASGEVFWWNQRFAEYTGQTLEAIQGWGWSILYDPDELPTITKRWLASLETGEPFEMELRLKAASGEYNWFLSRVVPVLGDDGRVWRWFGTNTDISAALEVQRQLREIADAQRRFVSDAAHELRAPLTAIGGNIDLIRRYPNMSFDERDEALSDAGRETARLSRLITDLLVVARGDASQIAASEPIQLADLLSETLRVAAYLGTHELRSVAFESGVVLGNRDRLKQLTLILLENAMKYSPATAPVTLALRCSDGWAEISVVDGGPGIPAEHLSRVFERFYRADAARTPGKDPGGTGLGLPIAKLIAEAHGGTVSLESTVGIGTTAIVRLPLQTETA
jgi:PAS domain S-box-containing protein